jgi:hypothetical protein
MKTKEEILKENVNLYFSSHHEKSRWNGEGEHGGAEWHTDKAIAPDLYAAMDEYAKQQAIDFIKWAMSAALQGDHYGGVMFGLPLGPNNEEEAYNQFIESQNKQHGAEG